MYLWILLLAPDNSSTSQVEAAAAASNLSAYSAAATSVDVDRAGDVRACLWIPQYAIDSGAGDAAVAELPSWAQASDLREGTPFATAQAAWNCNVFGECS